MLQLKLASGEGGIRRVLLLGCHSDDIEIGCGGTVLALTRAIPGLEVTWVVFSAEGERAREARESAEAFLVACRDPDIRLHSWRDGFLANAGPAVKEAFEDLKPLTPDVILTHARSDLHQDHRFVSELTWQTFRDHLILEYEIPKYDGDLGLPNVFVSLDAELVDEKVRLLEQHHATQSAKHWFDGELFRGLMRIRGMESATRYAEAYVCRKLSLIPT